MKRKVSALCMFAAFVISAGALTSLAKKSTNVLAIASIWHKDEGMSKVLATESVIFGTIASVGILCPPQAAGAAIFAG